MRGRALACGIGGHRQRQARKQRCDQTGIFHASNLAQWVAVVHLLPAGGAVERLRAVKKLPKPLALAILCILLVILAAGFELLRFAGSFVS